MLVKGYILDMVDIIIFSLPSAFNEKPPAAPAILKGAVESYGFSCKTIDLGIDLFNKCNRRLDRYINEVKIFEPYEVTIEDIESLTVWAKYVYDTYINNKTTIVGLSVFSNLQQRAAFVLSKYIKTISEVTVIIGGKGAIINSTSLTGLISRLEESTQFHALLSNKKFADYAILSNEFTELPKILSTKVRSNTADCTFDKFNIVNSNYTSPVPNYDDYDLDLYLWHGNKALLITGSTGCVRDCTFCDVAGFFGKYKYRTATDVFSEMVLQINRYQIYNFDFTDSLVNGSTKTFYELLEKISDYNSSNDKKITWIGQYITRPQSKLRADHYSLLVSSGAHNLTIGTESGDNDVLAAMRKQVTVEDTLDELEQLSQHNLKSTLLMFSGFYNETEERFLNTLRFIIACQKYVANGTVRIDMGPPLFLNEFMPLVKNKDKYQIENADSKVFWTVKSDPLYTYPERVRRRLIQHFVTVELGYFVGNQQLLNLTQIEVNLQKYLDNYYENTNSA